MLMIVEIQIKTIVKHHVFTEYNGKKKNVIHETGESETLSSVADRNVKMVELLWRGIWQHLAKWEMHFLIDPAIFTFRNISQR